MNYEKKYKEALERAKALIETNTSDALFHLKDIESIFPDLAESEDERIRKEIIEHLRQDIELEQILSEEKGSDWIAWLEKQGKQNLANSAKTCKEDEEMFDMTEINLRELRDRFGEKYGRVGECIAWFNSLKEKLGVK